MNIKDTDSSITAQQTLKNVYETGNDLRLTVKVFARATYQVFQNISFNLKSKLFGFFTMFNFSKNRFKLHSFLLILH